MRMPRLVSKKLQASDARHFVGDTMFDRCARATCAAGVNMPKKELLENWTLASMIHDRHWRGTAPPARVVAEVLEELEAAAPRVSTTTLVDVLLARASFPNAYADALRCDHRAGHHGPE